jgi:hypothetical protein
MRHIGLLDASAVRALTTAVGQFTGFCGLVASARCSHLLLPPPLPASCAAIPLPVVAASTDCKDGATAGVTTPAQTKPVRAASMSNESFRHFHHNKACGC